MSNEPCNDLVNLIRINNGKVETLNRNLQISLNFKFKQDWIQNEQKKKQFREHIRYLKV